MEKHDKSQMREKGARGAGSVNNEKEVSASRGGMIVNTQLKIKAPTFHWKDSTQCHTSDIIHSKNGGRFMIAGQVMRRLRCTFFCPCTYLDFV